MKQGWGTPKFPTTILISFRRKLASIARECHRDIGSLTQNSRSTVFLVGVRRRRVGEEVMTARFIYQVYASRDDGATGSPETVSARSLIVDAITGQ